MPGKYSKKIRRSPLYHGRFDACQPDADECAARFTSCPTANAVAAQYHETGIQGTAADGEPRVPMNGQTRRCGCSQRYQAPANVGHAATFEPGADQFESWFCQ